MHNTPLLIFQYNGLLYSVRKKTLEKKEKNAHKNTRHNKKEQNTITLPNRPTSNKSSKVYTLYKSGSFLSRR